MKGNASLNDTVIEWKFNIHAAKATTDQLFMLDFKYEERERESWEFKVDIDFLNKETHTSEETEKKRTFKKRGEITFFNRFE